MVAVVPPYCVSLYSFLVIAYACNKRAVLPPLPDRLVVGKIVASAQASDTMATTRPGKAIEDPP